MLSAKTEERRKQVTAKYTFMKTTVHVCLTGTGI